MKSKNLLYVIVALLFITISWSIPANLSTGEQEKLPIYDIRNIPGEAKVLKLSEFISDFRVIPIETKAECLIGYSRIFISRNSILVSSSTKEGSHLYRFDKDGKFLNEIGKIGRGPGEHTGNIQSFIYNEDNGTVMAKWTGSAQLFKADGTFLNSINQPIQFVSNVYPWSDSEWFSTGTATGPAIMLRDSFALVFYTNNGKITRLISRKTYPLANDKEYIPSPGEASVYKFNETMKIYFGGNDTIFKIVDKKIIPSAIILSGNNSIPRNTSVDPANLAGKYFLNVLAESDNNLILTKEKVNKLEAYKRQDGGWSEDLITEGFNLLIIDKKTKKGGVYTLKDDIFSILPDGTLPDGMPPNFHTDNRFSVTLQANALLKYLTEKKDLIKRSPDGQKVVEQLKDLSIESNPVIFTFSLKDRIPVE